MKLVEDQARVERYERLVLECREGNAHAIDFYQNLGYVLCAKYPPYEDEADAVCMEKRL
jgi:ribosomal protein S18 acetylase RimI-like enzyme